MGIELFNSFYKWYGKPRSSKITMGASSNLSFDDHRLLDRTTNAGVFRRVFALYGVRYVKSKWDNDKDLKEMKEQTKRELDRIQEPKDLEEQTKREILEASKEPWDANPKNYSSDEQ